MLLQDEESQRLPEKSPEATRDMGQIPSSSPQREPTPPNALMLDFWPPEPRDNTFLWFKLLSLWYFVMVALAN